jgi:phenylacetate-CoA ligase
MALEFKLGDFAHPLEILKLRSRFKKSQWYTEEEQVLYQERLLRRITEHSYRHVPYYRDLFDSIRLKPADIRRLSDLNKLPLLTKAVLRAQFGRLEASNSHAYGPRVLRTSGTTGQRTQFLVDRRSNALEFVYYWRYWNWAGYKLGAPFAEFSSVFFSADDARSLLPTWHQRSTNRLLLNSRVLSDARVRSFVAAIRRHRALFLKGLPSVLYYFALSLRRQGVNDISFKAVFSTGETLVPRVRKLVEEMFGCKVYDSYGHLERTVAISECPRGGLHLNPDYGICEFVRQDDLRAEFAGATYSGTGYPARIVGTSLYNFSMPLLRYDVGDIVLVEPEKKCACGRQFTLVSAIAGRQSEVIMTPEGGAVTAAFLVFEDVPDILGGQILQESLNELRVRIVPDSQFSAAAEARLTSRIRTLVGPTMRITMERCAGVDELRGESGKVRAVVSKLDCFTSSPG